MKRTAATWAGAALAIVIILAAVEQAHTRHLIQACLRETGEFHNYSLLLRHATKSDPAELAAEQLLAACRTQLRIRR